MKNKRMVRAFLIVVLFAASIFFIGRLLNPKSIDTAEQLPESSYPIITIVHGDQNIGVFRGYKKVLQESGTAGSTIPVDQAIEFQLDSYENEIESVSYRLSTVHNGSFLESGVIEEMKEENGIMFGNIRLGAELEIETEYLLTFVVKTEQYGELFYQCRVTRDDNYHTAEYLAFAKEFTENTFNQEGLDQIEAADYLETDEMKKNPTYHSADINSTIEHIGWGDMNPVLETDATLIINDIDFSTASVTASYQISTEGDRKSYYNVTDFYRLRYTESRMYLLDYQRKVQQILDVSSGLEAEKNIKLGIRDSNVHYMENKDGTALSFVQTGSLYSYQAEKGSIAAVFDFPGQNPLDKRNDYDGHDIRIMSVENNGSTTFVIYGYMSRGSHEGENGAGIYYYNAEENKVEEKVFLPSTRPMELIKADIEKLCYKSGNNLYVYFSGTIYEINLEERSHKVLKEKVRRSEVAAAKDQHLLAYAMDAEAEGGVSLICVMNLKSGEEQIIKGQENEVVRPAGFMDADTVYGRALRENIGVTILGVPVFPMTKAEIMDKDGEIVKEYAVEGKYITNIQMMDTMIKLQLAVPGANGLYQVVNEENINMNLQEEAKNVTIGSYTADKKKRAVKLELSSASKAAKIAYIQPDYMVFEVSRNMELEESAKDETVYYVFGKGKYQGYYEKPADAVSAAKAINGYVKSSNGTYLWRKIKHDKIMLEVPGKASGKNPLGACLQSMLAYEGKDVDADTLQQEGKTPYVILDENMEGRVVDLTGVSLEEGILSKISNGTPVLAVNQAGMPYVIIGYDAYNIIVMNPQTGSSEKMGMKDSEALFQAAGYQFISYEK